MDTLQMQHYGHSCPLEGSHPIGYRPIHSKGLKSGFRICLNNFDDPPNRHDFLVPHSFIPCVPNCIDKVTDDSINKFPSRFGDTTSPVEVLQGLNTPRHPKPTPNSFNALFAKLTGKEEVILGF